jgi:branched-chain amino acid aminotransferase
VLRLDDHWARLRDSALRLDARTRIALNRADLARALGQTLALAELDEARVRLTLTVPEGELYIALQPFVALPAELFERGAAAALCPFVPHATAAKATASISPLRGAKAALPAWAHEGLMVDAAGRILEGLSSNFFAVHRGMLRTANENVIIGTTRALVLELAAQLAPVTFEPVRVNELDAVAECFITSVSREVLPIVRVDERIIGGGKPGPMTLELLRRFRDWVRVRAETV